MDSTKTTEDKIIALEAKVALLEKVAEASEQSYREQMEYGYASKATTDREYAALRAAGYLEEGK